MTAILLFNDNEIENYKKTYLNLSVSKIKVFDSCPKKYKYQYIDKLPRKDWDFLVLGKHLHEILERFHKSLLENPKQDYEYLLSECQDKSLETWGSKLSSEAKIECYNIVQKYLRKFIKEKEASKSTILSLEKQFFIGINNEILLNGFIDVFGKDHDGIYKVSDYKSTKNKKYLKNDFFQLQVYAFFIYLMFPDVKKVRGEYILLRHDFESISVEFSQKEILETENLLLKYKEEIKKEKLFRANPSPLCDFCDANDICEQRWINPKNLKKQPEPIKFNPGETEW